MKIWINMFAAGALLAAAMGTARAEAGDATGALEFITARPLIERLDFRAQAKATPELRARDRRPIMLPPELPKFKPVSIWLTMGTGF